MADAPTEAGAEQARLFNDSLERCTADPRFLERFYERFTTASPEVAAKFEGVDLRRQARMLKVSLYLMMYAAWGRDEWSYHLDRIATLHGRGGFDVRPGLYDLWLENLLAAVADFDPEFGEPVGAAWRAVLAPGIAFMKARY